MKEKFKIFLSTYFYITLKKLTLVVLYITAADNQKINSENNNLFETKIKRYVISITLFSRKEVKVLNFKAKVAFAK